MAWQGIEGHDDIVELFRRSIAAGRLGSTFLFVGPSGVGKRTFALKLAQSLLCDVAESQPLDPCGTCPQCAQVAALSHPDLDIVAKPADKSAIPIRLLIGDKDHRMREGLCARIALKPMAGGRKVGIIDDADHLNVEGANCLLKTLEEPPARSVLILIGTSPQRQLPTIRSRSQIVRFKPLPMDVCANLIVKQGLEEDPTRAKQLAEMSGGSLTAAGQWCDPDLWAFRSDFLTRLASKGWNPVSMARTISEFVDAAGKEAAKRRDRLRLVIGIAEQFFTQAMHQSVSAAVNGDDELKSHLSRYSAANLAPETLANCVERCQQARIQVDSNANQSTLIECWIDDLQSLIHI